MARRRGADTRYGHPAAANLAAIRRNRKNASRVFLRTSSAAIAVYLETGYLLLVPLRQNRGSPQFMVKLLIESVPVSIVQIRIVKDDTFVMCDCLYRQLN